MTTTHHTPGPWHVNSMVRIESADFGLIASIRGDFVDRSTTANACLIAAAPDLLKALENLLHNQPDDVPPEVECAAWNNAASAIAKARGEAQYSTAA